MVSLLGRSWAAFTAKGNPSTATVAWPISSARTGPHVHPEPAPYASAGLRTAKCFLWDSVPSP